MSTFRICQPRVSWRLGGPTTRRNARALSALPSPGSALLHARWCCHWLAASQGRPVTATRSLSRLVCQPASAAKDCTIWDPTAGLLFGAPSDAVPLSADVRPSQSPLLPGSREGWRRLSRPACRPALADACLNCAPPSYERAREDLRVLRWRQADQATSGMSHVASIALAPQTCASHATRSPNLCSGEQIPPASPRANSRAIVPTAPPGPCQHGHPGNCVAGAHGVFFLFGIPTANHSPDGSLSMHVCTSYITAGSSPAICRWPSVPLFFPSRPLTADPDPSGTPTPTLPFPQPPGDIVDWTTTATATTRATQHGGLLLQDPQR